jgi:hypothetical protein
MLVPRDHARETRKSFLNGFQTAEKAKGMIFLKKIPLF